MRVFNVAFAAVTVAVTLLSVLCMLLLGMTEAADLATTSQDVYQVIFHLKRTHSEEKIDKLFWDISTPGRDQYRKFLTHSQLQELVGAPRSVISKARHYLETEAGCTKVEQLKTNDALICTLSKKEQKSLKMAIAVEEAFAIQDQEQKGIFRMDVTNRMPLQVRKLLRSAVAWRHADKTLKPKNLRQLSQEKNLGQPGMTQTPSTINQRYKVPNSASFPPLASNVTASVGEFEGQYFLPSDVKSFAQKFGLKDYNIEIMGANSPGGASGDTEGILDVEFMGSIFNGTIGMLWAEGSSNNNDPGQLDFTSWIDKLLARSNVPAVVSISWGLGDYNYAWEPSLLVQDNDAFRKAGLVGVTLMAASGDSGVGTRRQILQCTKFNPSWPASSPFITSVGALYANSQTEDEIAISWTGSGFSDTFPRPEYQNEAVNNYLHTAQNLPKASYYNASGYNYPTMAALGSNFNIVVNGQSQLVSGTSAASPTAAGIIALVVAERVAAGKPQFGFLNPTIFKLGKVGQDITQGQNQDDNCIPFVPIQGFPATVGYDACTGFGSPDYEFLRQNL